jgi:hypothetical protein
MMRLEALTVDIHLSQLQNVDCLRGGEPAWREDPLFLMVL